MLATKLGPSQQDRWFAGTLLRTIAGDEETNGCLTVMEQRARLGFSPPLHVHHREDTALFVLEGQLNVHSGEVDSVLTAGGFQWLPRDVAHTFRVETDEAHFLEFTTPAGAERFHIDASDPAPIGELPPQTTPDIGRLLASARKFGIDIIGPPMM